MNLLSSVLVLLVSLTTHAAIEKNVFSADDLKSISVKSGMGDVKIIGSDSEKAYVTAESSDLHKDSCRVEYAKKDGELRVKVRKTGDDQSFDDCEVDLSIEVPQKLALSLKHGMGDVKVKGNYPEISLRLGRGDTSVQGQVENLQIKTGSGEIEVSGQAENAKIATGIGQVKITYAKVPQKGHLEVKTGTGDATVVLPENSKVQSQLKSGLGELTNEIGSREDAEFKVSMKTGMGDLKIKKASKK